MADVTGYGSGQAKTPPEKSAALLGGLTWAPIGVMGLLLAVLTRAGSGPIRDPDAWWHLRIGSLLRSGEMTIFETKPLSAFATEPWVPRDWIPQLVSSKMEESFGLPGVAWLYGASMIVFAVVGYFICRREVGAFPATLSIALCLMAGAGSFSQRPQMVSLILLFVVVGAWLRTAKDLKVRWWIIPLMWIWACSHGYWYFGIAVGLVVTLGIFFDRGVDGKRCASLVAVSVLSIVAVALTPGGPSVLLSAFQTNDKWKFVTEWQPPNFTDIPPATSMVMATLIIVIWARGRQRVSWARVGLFSLGLVWILMAARTVTPGAIVMAPLLASALQSSLPNATEKPSSGEIVSITTTALLCLMTLAFVVPHTASSPGAVPTALDGDLEEMPPETSVLNEYVLGGWLHWRHPHLETVIDGFTDGYTVKALEDYASARSVEPGWKEYVADTDAEVALLADGSPLAFALSDQLGWTESGRAKGYILLVAP